VAARGRLTASGFRAPGSTERPQANHDRPEARSPRALRRRARELAFALGISTAFTSALAAQDPVPPDTIPTEPVDTLLQALPDSVREVFAEPDSARVPAFPQRLLPLRGDAYLVYDCDDTCIQNSTALSLLELLRETVPGITSIRPGYFAGPHFALQGPYGPGFVRMFVDGREIASLAARQTDLRRVSLVYLERVRVTRDAAGLLVDVITKRHDDGAAYSRISGGTGEPSLQFLNGIFTNGIGGNLTMEGAFNLLDVGRFGVENDRFDIFTRLNWMPGSNRFGLQLEYRNESVDRTAADTADVSHRQLTLRGRLNLTSDIQAEAYAARTSLRADSVTLQEANTIGFELSTSPGDGRLALGVSSTGGSAYPSFDVRLNGGYPIGNALQVEVGGALQSWDEFSTSQLRAALAFDPPGFPIVLRADGSTGSRGVPYPVADRADSVSFHALGASAHLTLGPYELNGRYAIQNLSRQLPFGASFDSLLAASETLDVTSWEIGARGPLIPIGALIPGLAPIQLNGWWRHQDSGEVDAFFLPADLIRAELLLHDDFFDGNLEIWLSAFVENRSAVGSVRAGELEPVMLSGYSWTGGHFMFKIGSFRFFWRLTNPTGVSVNDIAGAPFPIQVNVFGIRWEFFN
jgi:hypothetical protein